MSLQDEVQAGRYDHYLIEGKSEAQDDDMVMRAEGLSMARAVVEGRLDPSAMFEGVIQGPGHSGEFSGTPGTNPAAVIAAEDAGWVQAGNYEGAAGAAFAGAARDQMVRYLYWLYAHHPIAHNVIEAYTTHTIGEGFRVMWKADPDRELWDQIAEEIQWEARVEQIVRHTYLLGEWFTLLFPLTQRVLRGQDGDLTLSRELERSPDAPRTIRGLGPEQIETVIVRGDPFYDRASVEDAETVIAYKRPGEKFLGAADVVHHRAERIGNLTRGVAVLYPVLRYLRYWDKWIENRHWLNFARARVPLVRKVAGGQARVTAEANRWTKLPPPGVMVTENMTASYEFPALNLQADDARHDGRAILLAIAAGVNLPEYMATGDASNANFSSTMAAESPTVKMFERLQGILIPQLSTIISAVTGKPKAAFRIQAGQIIRRSLKQVADGVTPLVDRGILSKRTACVLAGQDWDREMDYMEEEHALALERQGFQAAPPVPPDQGGRPPRPVMPGDDGMGNRRQRPSE